MPLVNRDYQLIQSQKGQFGELPTITPTWGETFGAAIRETWYGSVLTSRTMFDDRDTVEQGFNLWDHVKGTKYEKHFPRLADINNSGAMRNAFLQIDQEEEDDAILAHSGAQGIVAMIATGVVDPLNLMPGAAIIRTAGKGVSIAKTALTTGVAAGFAETISEMVLQDAQQSRTPGESTINVGSSVLLGSMLGTALGKVIQRAEVKGLERSLQQNLAAPRDVTVDDMKDVFDNAIATEGGSLSAAQTPKVPIEDLEIQGKAAQILSRTTLGNPMLRMIRSSSQAARQIAADLPEMGFALKMTGRGESQPQAVETFTTEWLQGRRPVSQLKHDKFYRDSKKAGGTLTRGEFNIRVGRAMRRGDRDELNDPYISQSAQMWRKDIFEPLKEEAISRGLLPKNVEVSTAVSYFTRVFNREKITAREDEFTQIVRNFYANEIRNLEQQGLVEIATESDAAQEAEDIARGIVAKLTGRESIGDKPIYDIAVPSRLGPLKERTFNIPDELIEAFLESDISYVSTRYTRVMAAETELARRFGKPDMSSKKADIQSDYVKLRDQAIADTSLTDVAREKRLTELSEQEARDLSDMAVLRDRMRGTYLLDQNASGFGRMTRAVNAFNYVRAMGGVTLSSLPDIARAMMVHGLGPVMRDGLIPLITNLKQFKLSVADARIGGTAGEIVNNARIATWAELDDPYSRHHPTERWISNATSVFSRISGLTHWNQYMKDFTAVVTQNRILRNAEQAATNGFDSLSRKEQRYMAFLGLGRDDAEQVGNAFRRFGSTEQDFRVANTETWGDSDRNAQRLFRAATNKEVNSIIVTKGIGDTPAFADAPLGRVLLQFKSFALASHQRVLMRASQDVVDAPVQVLAGLAFQMTVGMFVYYLKTIESDRDVSDNPGKWFAEGFDRSGIAAVLMEFNNIAEKLNAPGFYRAAQAIFPNREQSAPASRYAIRNTAGGLLGPTFGAATDLLDVTGAGFSQFNAAVGLADDQNVTESQLNAARRLMPFSTLPGIRPALEYLVIPELQETLNQ